MPKIGSKALPVADDLTSEIDSDPFMPFCGWKKTTIPLLPAGQATFPEMFSIFVPAAL
jgi:hypothetical protein